MKNTNLLQFAGVPKRVRYVLEQTDVYIPKKDLHRSLFIYGKPGVGKTVLAAAILAESLFSKIHIETVQEMLSPSSAMYIGEKAPDFSKKYIFIRVPELLQKLKKSFSAGPQENNEQDLIDLYSKASLLVLDDIGTELTTNWAYSILYLIVDNRYNEMLPTIFTSNLSLEQLMRRFVDERLVSRIIEMCGREGIRKITEECNPDYRLENFKREKHA